jgi:hypothetical protein
MASLAGEGSPFSHHGWITTLSGTGLATLSTVIRVFGVDDAVGLSFAWSPLHPATSKMSAPIAATADPVRFMPLDPFPDSSCGWQLVRMHYRVRIQAGNDRRGLRSQRNGWQIAKDGIHGHRHATAARRFVRG